MKKMIPVITAIVLIFLIAGVAFGSKILERYSYSKEEANLEEYFAITGENDVPVILQDEMIMEKALFLDGVYYFELNMIHQYLNTRFYWDQLENLLIYTTPTQIVKNVIGSNAYSVDGVEADAGYLVAFSQDNGENQSLYIAADFVKLYTNFSYETFDGPKRMQVYNQWSERNIATVKKDSAVRYRGGVKSPILKSVSQGEKLIVLEEMENWFEVKTLDGFIGYIEGKHLSEQEVETPTPVSDYQVPEYTSLAREHKINLGWHVIGGVAGNDTLNEAVANAKGLNVISPTWFKISDNQGNFTSFATKQYVDNAHQKGMEVWGLIDDFSYEINMLELLSATTNRKHLISGLVQAALDCGMDGINIDFEKIGTESGPHYVQFLRELSIQCRLNNLVLSIDNYVPFNFNDYYNREEQGVIADYVIIMGYDEHWHGSGEPGSVASISYVKNGIEKMIEEVPAHKIINALPLYSILWKTNGAEVTDDYVTMVNQDNLMSTLGMNPEWDEETCQNYGELESGGITYQIWLEDKESIDVKLNVMRNYDLGGVAVWRLGYEPASIWDSISSYSGE